MDAIIDLFNLAIFVPPMIQVNQDCGACKRNSFRVTSETEQQDTLIRTSVLESSDVFCPRLYAFRPVNAQNRVRIASRQGLFHVVKHRDTLTYNDDLGFRDNVNQ
jgi:hypothetical protein